MAEKMVRCVRCHEVFDAELGPCTKCGTPYKEPVAAPALPEGTYSERYATAAPDPEPVMAPLPERRNSTYLIWGGVALIAAALVVALLFELGFGGAGSGPTPRPVVLAAPSAVHTLPPTISTTLDELNDPNFSAHLSVQGRVQVTATNASKAQIIVVNYDGIVSGGNQWGILKVGSSAQEAMFVNGSVYVRTPPATKWTAASAVSSYKLLCPMFGLKDERALTMVGQEIKGGQLLNHLQATHWWTPDLSRLTLYDMSFLSSGLSPDVTSLDLWTLPDGTPVSATFSAKTLAGQVALVDIEVNYTFSNVGQAVDIEVPVTPGASWTESPGPSGVATASPVAAPSTSPKK